MRRGPTRLLVPSSPDMFEGTSSIRSSGVSNMSLMQAVPRRRLRLSRRTRGDPPHTPPGGLHALRLFVPVPLDPLGLLLRRRQTSQAIWSDCDMAGLPELTNSLTRPYLDQPGEAVQLGSYIDIEVAHKGPGQSLAGGPQTSQQETLKDRPPDRSTRPPAFVRVG